MQLITQKTDQLLVFLHGNILAVDDESCHLSYLLLTKNCR